MFWASLSSRIADIYHTMLLIVYTRCLRVVLEDRQWKGSLAWRSAFNIVYAPLSIVLDFVWNSPLTSTVCLGLFSRVLICCSLVSLFSSQLICCSLAFLFCRLNRWRVRCWLACLWDGLVSRILSFVNRSFLLWSLRFSVYVWFSIYSDPKV